MTMFCRAQAQWALRVAVSLTIFFVIGVPGLVSAVEIAEPAPGFTLPATTGGDISLSDFRGKKFVLLEFYGADFAPA